MEAVVIVYWIGFFLFGVYNVMDVRWAWERAETIRQAEVVQLLLTVVWPVQIILMAFSTLKERNKAGLQPPCSPTERNGDPQ